MYCSQTGPENKVFVQRLGIQSDSWMMKYVDISIIKAISEIQLVVWIKITVSHKSLLKRIHKITEH